MLYARLWAGQLLSKIIELHFACFAGKFLRNSEVIDQIQLELVAVAALYWNNNKNNMQTRRSSIKIYATFSLAIIIYNI